MTFLNPILVSAGLACVAIPILIHILMRRRRRPIAWGAMKFLLEAYRRQRRRINLEQFLLLASRCLLVAMLALALGKPILAGSDTGAARPARTVYLLIDNSITSGVETGDGEALERSKDAALAILRKLDASRGDRAALVALGSPAEGVVLPASADVSGVGEAVKQLTRGDSRADFAGAVSLVRDAMKAPGQAGRDLSSASIVVLSELRAGSVDAERTLPALGVAGPRLFVLAPAEQSVTNTAITGVRPLRTLVVSGEDAEGGVTPVRVSLRRFGPGVREAAISKVVVEAFPAGSPEATRRWRGESVVRWEPGHESAGASIAATIPPAARPGEVFVLEATIDRDVLGADNVRRRPVPTRRRLEVGVIAPGAGGSKEVGGFGAADWWTLALSPRGAGGVGASGRGEIRVTRIDPSQLAGVGGEAALTNLDAIIVPRPDLLDGGQWALVRRACDGGALVIVTPPGGVETHTWSDAFTRALGLEWTLPREATVLPGEGAGLAVAGAGSDLLGMLAPELEDLLRPARVSRVLPARAATGTTEPVLTLSDGTAWITASQPGRDTGAASRGLVVYLASALEPGWTDIPTKPLMVPLAQELVRQGVGRAAGAGVFTAGSAPVLPAGTTEVTRVDPVGTGDGGVIRVDAGGRAASAIRRAGVFAARGVRDASLAVLAANPDTGGSATDALSAEAVTRWLSPVGDAIFLTPSGDTAKGTGETGGVAGEPERDLPPISTPLLIAAVCVGLVEMVLARVFSHAYAGGARGGPA